MNWIGILTALYRCQRSFEPKNPEKIKKTALANKSNSEEMVSQIKNQLLEIRMVIRGKTG
jgi:hypothetical protein